MYIDIETERLLIRPIALTDAKFILDLVNSKGWLKFIGDRNISNEDDAKTYIQKILDNSNFYYNVFELKETKEAIGVVTFLKRDNEKFPDIGFALLPEFEKNGYTLEASKAYLDKISHSNIYEDIIAITLSNNKRSINLLQKLGLNYTGNHKRGEEILSYYSLKTKVRGNK
ncbi:GNAT family N-acetyltransferase [Aquimarina sp. D1M17]|uniref:GNAT family N-acetyltransferase n=1 Tax=Aquimarina acroporae TaxID=2937283 RepID=UPI0020C14240|nr:GNAT family N-acetyltransferase [Aquimarina acroporae]MCK8521544.1 GNAT family N-acetyltransferase [Aquimarina acroporae]